MKCKFKIGDIVHCKVKGHYYTSDENDWVGRVVGFDVPKMNDWDMAVETIKAIDHPFSKLFVRSNEFELVNKDASTEELHITVKGNETIAVYKHDGKTEKAVAKCSPEDKFDFKVGAKLALERLGIIEDEPVYTHRRKLMDPDRLYNYGYCGIETNYKDAHGKPLCVGDIVTLYSDNYCLGEYALVQRGDEQFVMSIRAVCDSNTGKINGGYSIVKVKSWTQVPVGYEVNGVKYG
jgi:hypothetical protein